MVGRQGKRTHQIAYFKLGYGPLLVQLIVKYGRAGKMSRTENERRTISK